MDTFWQIAISATSLDLAVFKLNQHSGQVA